MALTLCFNFGFMVESIRDNEQYNKIVRLLDMCLIPLIGGFLLTIVMPNYINSRRSLLLIIPSVAFLIINTLVQSKTLYLTAFTYTILIAVTTFVIAVVISFRYDRYLKNNYSNIDNKTVGWIRLVIYLFTAWYLAWNFIITQDNPLIDSAYYLFIITIWILIYKYSIKHIVAFDTKELFEATLLENQESNEREVEKNKIEPILKTYMDTECPWLNPSLTLQELASALGTNRTYLSEYINNTLNTNYYDYLNSFRISFSCELLLSNPSLSTLQVGEQSGFKSLSTYRRAFEKHMGCSPTAYRKQNNTQYR